MDMRLIRRISEMVSELDLGSLEVQEGDFRIRVEGKAAPQYVYQTKSENAPVEKAVSEAGNKDDAGVDFNEIHTVVSPMVGVFYAAASPESEPFVKIGSKVKKGDTLCIVEAMKLMNEITSDMDGEIVDICVKNGDVVEYGQTLFKIF